MSYFNDVLSETTSIAKTIEAAPLKPAQEMKFIWLKVALNGSITIETAKGLATKDRKSVIRTAGKSISGILCGKERKPIKKKITTCDNAVIPSKKYIRLILFLMSLFPRIIPVI